MATITGILRKALKTCGQSRYAVSRATGILESTHSRFIRGKPLRSEHIDKLCAYLGLQLVVKAGARKAR